MSAFVNLYLLFLVAMNRDTEELPAIIADLDGNVAAIQSSL